MLGDLVTLILSRRPSELPGKFADGPGNRIPHSLGPVACEGTFVLGVRLLPIIWDWAEVKEGAARCSFQKGPNRRLLDYRTPSSLPWREKGSGPCSV